MKTRLIFRSVGIALLVLLGPLGCFRHDANKESSSQPPATQVAVAAGEIRPFDARLLEIANSYKNYPRFNDHLVVGPTLCAPGFTSSDTKPMMRVSASQDSTTHGRKVYWLYVKEAAPGSAPGDYVAAGKPNPIGQVTVKESWVAEEVKPGDKNADTSALAYHNGRTYHAGTRADLFIMYKLDPQTPGTDQGWVYGTVSADGKTVTSAGRLDNCIQCHKDAPHDRLFGMVRK